eukprot:TRINITY_DN2240_c0_g1_i1.p1 TRINITY_DN2240_c0_g1~~TRINITY_DN2240_c0_g1_i1.p1  ORF type:complete len:528 (-),score=202.70 TRINITY_DN2240_c0_g1_i1:39-1493(-)
MEGAVPDPDVIVLNSKNFDSIVRAHELIAVEFYAPWCGHCKHLQPQWAAAATELKKNDPPIALAKVDATEENELASKYKVNGYPTILLFRHGREFPYKGPRETQGIVTYMRKQVGPAIKSLTTMAEADAFFAASSNADDDISIVGFFPSKEVHRSALHSSLLLNADNLRETIRFAKTTDSEIIAKYGQTDKDVVVAFKPYDERRVVYQGDSRTKNLEDFIIDQSFPLVGNYTRERGEKYWKRQLPVAKLFMKLDWEGNGKMIQYYLNRLKPLATSFRSKLLFTLADTDSKMEQEMKDLGVEASKTPLLVIHDMANRKKFHYNGAFKVPNMKTWVESYFNNELTPFIRSEPVPTSHDGHVKVVVGSTFEEIVNDPNKDVLIEFYAPWCGHCQQLAPKYRDLAKKVKNVDTLVIAKIDATANDYPSSFQVNGYPSIFLVPARANAQPIAHTGEREVDDLLSFIKKHAMHSVNLGPRRKKNKAKEEL